ncbi:hypothetical protein CYMTET_24259 [Cymbomonas tetramitiformis]|uniref:Uncharacterized protein n=1 Tax=Cymbomonas tetramitiformis TaxID=36881 RepID=A0AAE0FW81_9CHLO|nr:hypothetical protein CYMTET_24259 [Cymbomonas tetramitiformis]
MFGVLQWNLFYFGCYLTIELTCYVCYLKNVATLASYRTGLPPSFNYAEWKHFFAERVRRESARRPQSLLALVSDIFWGEPVTHLSQENVKAMLLMMGTAREKHDGPTPDEDALMAEDLMWRTPHVNRAHRGESDVNASHDNACEGGTPPRGTPASPARRR